MKNMDKYVLGAVLYIIGWSIAFFVAWIVKEDEPSILEGCILAPGALELVCSAWLKSSKNKYCGKEGSEEDE